MTDKEVNLFCGCGGMDGGGIKPDMLFEFLKNCEPTENSAYILYHAMGEGAKFSRPPNADEEEDIAMLRNDLAAFSKGKRNKGAMIKPPCVEQFLRNAANPFSALRSLLVAIGRGEELTPPASPKETMRGRMLSSNINTYHKQLTQAADRQRNHNHKKDNSNNNAANNATNNGKDNTRDNNFEECLRNGKLYAGIIYSADNRGLVELAQEITSDTSTRGKQSFRRMIEKNIDTFRDCLSSIYHRRKAGELKETNIAAIFTSEFNKATKA